MDRMIKNYRKIGIDGRRIERKEKGRSIGRNWRRIWNRMRKIRK